MSEARHIIEIDDSPALLRLVEAAEATGRPIVLRRGGADVARIESVSRSRRKRHREITEADIAASKGAAGSWQGSVDVDRFLRENAESRRISTRSPVEL